MEFWGLIFFVEIRHLVTHGSLVLFTYIEDDWGTTGEDFVLLNNEPRGTEHEMVVRGPRRPLQPSKPDTSVTCFLHHSSRF
jgi:hypothetical protein